MKSGNYLNNVLALGEARRRSGAYEAILCAADGSVAEGASSNVFAVVGRRGAHAAAGGRASSTGSRAPRCWGSAAPTASPSREVALSPDELRGADEVFITSATRAVLPVTERSTTSRSGRRARPGHAPADGVLRPSSRAPECRVSRAAAALLPKFFVICSVILILTGVTQAFVRPRKPQRDAGRAPGQPRDDHRAGLGDHRRDRPAARPRG